METVIEQPTMWSEMTQLHSRSARFDLGARGVIHEIEFHERHRAEVIDD